MKEQDIDKFFRDKLANHTKQPLPQTWGKIHAVLQEKKKRRVVIAWRMAAGVALLAGVAWLTVNFDDKRTENVAVISKITKGISTETSKEVLKEIVISKVEIAKTEVAKTGISEIEVAKTQIQKTEIAEINIAKTTNKVLQNKQKLETKEVNKISNSNQVANEFVNQTANKIEENIAAQTLEIVPKTLDEISNEIANKIANEIKNEVATHIASEIKNEDTIEVIVKLGNGNTEIDSTNMIAKTTKKRTFLGKIWQKVREGETLTLADVGVKPPKLPKFLRKSE